METTTKYLLRWRGRQQGPFSVSQIEQLLATNKIGMFHEVLVDGRWLSLQNANVLPSTRADESVPLMGDETRPGLTTGCLSATDDMISLRWSGKSLGSISSVELERRLERQEIGMLHEVLFENHWITLNDYFVRRNILAARKQLAARSQAPGPAVLNSVSTSPLQKRGGRIALKNIGRTVKNGQRILKDINLAVEPNEFVALLGPSGSGKSTLMDAMTGRQRATEGAVTINGDDYYQNSWKFRELIGHVPQKDIVHLPLSVAQELRFAARLRLPAIRSRQAITERVDAVIEQIGLSERRLTRNANLSGGQVKRVSLGVELLADPTLLFLDEATSGLDAGIEARMMALFRKLADEGRSVICVTHTLENVCLCNLVAILVKGRLAYYGPPDELPGYFNIKSVGEVYKCLESLSPEEWASQFTASPQHQKYVAGRLAASAPPAIGSSRAPGPQPATQGFFHQYIVLTHRYFTVAFQDFKNILIILGQAPIIGGMLGIVFHSTDFTTPLTGATYEKILGLLLLVSAIWFGCFNACREIVKELPLYLRERAIGLDLLGYLGSKITVLSLLCVLQCSALLAVTMLTTKFRPDISITLADLVLTSFGGIMMGLLVSGLVEKEDKAMSLVPILLIPQVIFTEAFFPLNALAGGLAKCLVISYWSFDTMLHALPDAAAKASQPHSSLGTDFAIIAAFLVLLTIATSLVLKQKDP